MVRSDSYDVVDEIHRGDNDIHPIECDIISRIDAVSRIINGFKATCEATRAIEKKLNQLMASEVQESNHVLNDAESKPTAKTELQQQQQRVILKVSFDGDEVIIGGRATSAPMSYHIAIVDYTLTSDNVVKLDDCPAAAKLMSKIELLDVMDPPEYYAENYKVPIDVITQCMSNLVYLKLAPSTDDLTLILIATHLVKLTYLELEDCQKVTAGCYVFLTGHSQKNSSLQLDHLSMKLCSNVDDSIMKRLGRGQPKLQRLTINDTYHVTGTGLLHLRVLEQLEELEFMPLRSGVTDTGMQFLSCCFPNLQVLKVGAYRDVVVTEAGFRFARNFKNLRELHLINFWPSDVNMYHHLGEIPKLKELTIENSRVEDACLEAFSAAGSKISKLVLSDCPRISDGAIPHIAELSGLRALSLINCRRIQGISFVHLRTRPWPLTELDLTGSTSIIRDWAMMSIWKMEGLKILTFPRILSAAELKLQESRMPDYRIPVVQCAHII